MPDDEKPEILDQDLAHTILGKFLGDTPEVIVKMIDRLEDPVVAAAVIIRVCYELDPTQIAELLALLEDEDLDDQDEDEELDAETQDDEGADPAKA